MSCPTAEREALPLTRACRQAVDHLAKEGLEDKVFAGMLQRLQPSKAPSPSGGDGVQLYHSFVYTDISVPVCYLL